MPQPEELPLDFRALLRRIQDRNVPQEEANQLFIEHVLPVLEKLINNVHRYFLPEVRTWVVENGIDCIWEKLVQRPRNGHNPAYDPDRQDSSFLAWARTVLTNEARTEIRKRRKKEQLVDEKQLENEPARSSPQPEEPEQNHLADLKSHLQAALVTLLRVKELSTSGQRSNGVDYFAVLLLCIRVQLSRLIHRVLYGNNSGVACGAVVLDYVGEFFRECQQYPAALICLHCNGSKPHSEEENHLCQGWCQRRITAWTPTVGEIVAELDNRIRNQNDKPKDIWIVEQLSHAVSAARNTSANVPITVLAKASSNCWRQWVRRMRIVYSKLRENNAGLTPEQIPILDALLAADKTDASSDAEEE